MAEVVASFLLIRHAESPWSPDEMRSLSGAGRRAAKRLVRWLVDAEIEAIYSSPYRRAMETVAPLAAERGLGVEAMEALRERSLGVFSGLAFEDAVAATYTDRSLAHAGGESSRDAQRRVLTAVETLAALHLTRPIALSTHGNLITLLLSHFDPSIGFEFWRRLTFPDVYRLELFASGGGAFRRLPPPMGR